jgi:hypothetical protein
MVKAGKSPVVVSCRYRLPKEVRDVIKWLATTHKEHFTPKYLAESFDVNRSTISRCIHDKTAFNPGGRPKLSKEVLNGRRDKIKEVLERRSPAGKRMYGSSRRLAALLKKEDPDGKWSQSTVLRCVRATGGKFFIMPRIPGLSVADRRERLSFANKYRARVGPFVHVDEAYISVNCSTRQGVYWWKDDEEYEVAPEDFNRGDQYPVKLFVFGAIGKGFKHLKIIRLHGRKRPTADDDEVKPKRMGGQMYINQCLAGTVMKHLKESKSILIQDNAKAHDCNKTKAYLERQQVRQLPDRLPPRSCDLNLPIERCWALLKRHVQEDACNTIDELEESVKKHWQHSISQSTIDQMCRPEAWQARCDDVVVAGGSYTWGKRARVIGPT